MSSDPTAYTDFGPFVPNVGYVCPMSKNIVRHGHIEDLEAAFNAHGPNIAAFLVEPIQGEAGYL